MDIDNILYFFVVTTTLVKTVGTVINAIAHQNDTFSLPSPWCSVDVMHSSLASTQSTLLGGVGDGINRLL